ncbi:hypothetical protein [Ewingella americana]|uniref:Uncharacterized protein n=1 Tax=Ewingella americana TaxID=41202 RepID=A0A502GHC7_9GAMM|nr:hypothetical protein [Ewingella americana]TPG60133.1 hypothetical protein EAH77_16320 [Ewingella americana]
MATFGELSEKPSSVNFAINFQNGDMSFNDGGKTIFCTGYDKLVQDIDRCLKTHYNESTNEGNKVYSTLDIIDQYDEASVLSLIESDFRDALIRLKAAQYTSSLPDEQIRSIESVKASYYNGDYTTVMVRIAILNGLYQSVSVGNLVLTQDLTIRHLYEEV